MTTNDWVDPKVMVAIYAAVVSTVSLSWNIISSVNNNRRKIKIKTKFNIVSTKDVFGNFSPVVAVLSTEVTNFGKEEIHIKTIALNFCGKKIELMGVQADSVACIDDMSGKTKLPHILRKNERFKDDMGTDSLLDSIGNKLEANDKVRIEIDDTLGNKYFSSTMKYGDIIDHSKSAKEINRKSAKQKH